jgi:hypothetical protein
MQVILLRVIECRHPGCSIAKFFDRPSKHLRRTSHFDTAITHLSEMSQSAGNKISLDQPHIPIAAVRNEGSDTWHSGYGRSNPGAGSGVPRESCKSESPKNNTELDVFKPMRILHNPSSLYLIASGCPCPGDPATARGTLWLPTHVRRDQLIRFDPAPTERALRPDLGMS